MTLTWSNETNRSWRQSPIWWTLVLSLVIHALGLWLWTAVPSFLQHYRDQLPDWLRRALASERAVPPPAEPLKREFQPRPDEYEIPLSFIEVDPALAVTEPPKDAQFQSTANTLAQNVAAPKPELNQPFIGGTQEKFPKLLDVDRSQPKPEVRPKDPPKVDLADTDREVQEPKPSVPVPPKPVQESTPVKPEPQKQVAEKPPESQTKGELQVAMVKAGPVSPPRPPAPPSTPREEPPAQAPQEEQRATRRKSLKNLAQARQAKGIIVGDQMKQEGGVDRRGGPSMPVKRGPMGDYGARMWAAVQERWYGTLEAQKFAGEFRGKVTVDFKLHPDGNVTQVEVSHESADDGIYSMYCVAAIQLSASFGTWSNEMRTTYGPKPIECQCVFWY